MADDPPVRLQLALRLQSQNELFAILPDEQDQIVLRSNLHRIYPQFVGSIIAAPRPDRNCNRSNILAEGDVVRWHAAWDTRAVLALLTAVS
jgi:hypothetical protein